MIVKCGADIKEEQFAIQLIYQFEQIFKAEKLKLMLRPFEILSLGTDFGLVEMIKDTVPFTSLKEQMNKEGISTLNDFFVREYGKNVSKARKKFMRSLAAYSLVCYFLQIKDRHNGNILLHKDGYLIHIDFGFFLSNAPGTSSRLYSQFLRQRT
jgi:phosphatidylinositol kinase/protein kinase (PI-3  family)